MPLAFSRLWSPQSLETRPHYRDGLKIPSGFEVLFLLNYWPRNGSKTKAWHLNPCHNLAFFLYNVTFTLFLLRLSAPPHSPGAPSVHLLISFCVGKPPVQGRQEDQEMASGTQIRQKQTQSCRTTMAVFLISLCFSLCRVLCMQMFINITKHCHCAGWMSLLCKSLPKLFVSRVGWP